MSTLVQDFKLGLRVLCPHRKPDRCIRRLSGICYRANGTR